MTQRKLTRYALGAAVLCASTLATATEPLGVAVSGHIKPTQSQCGFEARDSVNFGETTFGELIPDAHGNSPLSQPLFAFSLECTQPTKVAVRFVDGKAGTAVDDDDFVKSMKRVVYYGDVDKTQLFGLGQDAHGHRIGALAFRLKRSPKVDYYPPGSDDSIYDLEAKAIKQVSGSQAWEHAGLPTVEPQGIYTIVPQNGTLPVAITRMSIPGTFFAVIDTRESGVDQTQPLKFEAKIGLEAVML